MAAPKKFEERALTRQKTEDFIHEVVNYVAKHRRSQWTQLSDAGETTIILETDSTNLLPAIARQSRCYRIISDLDIPGNNEPQFHLRMTKPIEILQTPYGYGRNGGPMDEDNAKCSSSLCCCFRSNNNPRVCLLKVEIESLNKFRSVKQLPRTDLIQMLQLLDCEINQKQTKRKRRTLFSHEQSHLTRLFFNFQKQKIFTIETLGSLSLEHLNALKDKIPGFNTRPFKIVMKRVRQIMDVRFEEAAALEEERLRLEILQEAEDDEKRKEEEMKRKEEEEEKAAKEQEEKGNGEEKENEEEVVKDKDLETTKDLDSGTDGTKQKEEKGKEKEMGENKEEDVEEEKKVETEEKTDGEEKTNAEAEQKNKEEEEKENENEEEQKRKEEEKEEEEQRKLKRQEEEEEILFDEDGNPLPEKLIVSDPIITTALYATLDLHTVRKEQKLYMSRENVEDDILLLNPHARGNLVSIYSKRGKELFTQYLLRQLYHLSYEEVLEQVQRILEDNVDAIDIEIEHHTHYLTTSLPHVIFGSYCLQNQWYLVIDLRQHGPLGSTLNEPKRKKRSNKHQEYEYDSEHSTKSKVVKAKGNKDYGQVGNYSPKETRELFVDLMLECSLMKLKMSRVFELRDIKHARLKFYQWRDNAVGKRETKMDEGLEGDSASSTSPLRKKKRRKEMTVLQRRRQVQATYPYHKSSARYLYQMIDQLKTVSSMHSEHLRLTVEGQLHIGEANEETDMVDAAADASSEFAPTELVALKNRLRSEIHLDFIETKNILSNSGIMLPIIIQSTTWNEEFFPCIGKLKEGCRCFWCGIWHCVPCFAPCALVGCCQAYCDKDRHSADKEIKIFIREQLRNDRAKLQVQQKKKELEEERLRRSGSTKKSRCSKYVVF